MPLPTSSTVAPAVGLKSLALKYGKMFGLLGRLMVWVVETFVHCLAGTVPILLANITIL